MAVQTTVTSREYAGNGSTVTKYPIPFNFLDVEHIRVAVKLTESDDDEVAVASNMMEVTRLGNGLGELRLLHAYDSSYTVRVYRQTPPLQYHVYQDAPSYEVALDRLTMCIQEGGGGGGAGVVAGPSVRSIEWAREVWGPTEPLVTGTRWAGYIHKGGALVSVRVSVNDTSTNTAPTLQILINGASLFSTPVAITGRTRLYTSELQLLSVNPGDEVVCVIYGSAAVDYDDFHGLQIDFSIEA